MSSKIVRRAAEVSTLLVFLSVSALSQTGQLSSPKQSSGALLISAAIRPISRPASMMSWLVTPRASS